MSLGAIQKTARTLVQYERLQAILAHNLSNVSTDGFKADLFRFELIAGAGSPVPSTALDLRQGSLRETGRQLDLALQGQGFFIVQTANGERLTRGGALQLDAAGVLVDSEGDPLMSREDFIVITGTDIEVRTDGTVVVDGAVVGTLRVETVDDPATLRKEGAGRFVATTGTRSVTSAETQVRQGAVEGSNFDVVLGTVELITIAREFQANMTVLRALDGVLDNVANDIARPAI